MQFFEIVVIGDFLPGTGWWIFALWTVFQVFHAVGLGIGSAPPKSLETGALHTHIYRTGAVRERNAGQCNFSSIRTAP